MAEVDISDREASCDAVAQSLRELSAELMRVVAGGGDPSRVMSLVANSFESICDYKTHNGHWPSSTFVRTAVDPYAWKPSEPRSYAEERLREIAAGSPQLREYEWADAKKDVHVGSLRVVASKLLGQSTQQAHGESLMFRGIKRLEDMRRENRGVGI
jgi:hypothetical protein